MLECLSSVVAQRSWASETLMDYGQLRPSGIVSRVIGMEPLA
jgi:hypothetical protein